MAARKARSERLSHRLPSGPRPVSARPGARRPHVGGNVRPLLRLRRRAEDRNERGTAGVRVPRKEAIKTEIRMFQAWRPGKAPTQITAELKPLWAWPVASSTTITPMRCSAYGSSTSLSDIRLNHSNQDREHDRTCDSPCAVSPQGRKMNCTDAISPASGFRNCGRGPESQTSAPLDGPPTLGG